MNPCSASALIVRGAAPIVTAARHPSLRRPTSPGQELHCASGSSTRGDDVRDDPQVMSVVDSDKPKRIVTIENAEGEVPKPGLRMQSSDLVERSLARLEEFRQFSLRNVPPWDQRLASLGSPPRDAADPKQERRQQGASMGRRRRLRCLERPGDPMHCKTAMMNVHANGPLRDARGAHVGLCNRGPQSVERHAFRLSGIRHCNDQDRVLTIC
jgi:hypothetical protein